MMKYQDCPFRDRLIHLRKISSKTTMSRHKPEHDHDLCGDSETGILYVDYMWSTGDKFVHEIMTLEQVRDHDPKIYELALEAAHLVGNMN